MGGKYSCDRAAAGAREMATPGAQLLWVDGETGALRKAFYPVLKVGFGSNQAMGPCSQSSLPSWPLTLVE